MIKEDIEINTYLMKREEQEIKSLKSKILKYKINNNKIKEKEKEVENLLKWKKAEKTKETIKRINKWINIMNDENKLLEEKISKAEKKINLTDIIIQVYKERIKLEKQEQNSEEVASMEY